MSDQPAPEPGAVVVPGPSLRTEGRVRVAVDAARAAVAALQGAGDAVRSLGR